MFRVVCELGLEGVIAENRESRYGANERGWIKTTNASYWRRDSEREAIRHSAERRARQWAGAPATSGSSNRFSSS